MKLHAFQKAVVERALAVTQPGQATLVVSPCGSGKTLMIAELALRLARGGVLILTHRRELVRQTLRTVTSMADQPPNINVIMNGDPRDGRKPSADIHVAAKDSFAKRRRTTSRPVGAVIVDECHRMLAKGYRSLIDRYPRARVFGFSATPIRHDNQLLSDYYDHFIEAAKPSFLMAAGYISDPRVFTVPDAFIPNVSGVKVRAGDYVTKQLEERVLPDRLTGEIVSHYKRRCSGMTAVCFCVSIKHALAVRDRFVTAGVPAEALYSGMKTPERERVLRTVASGGTKVVVNCMILTEGWDLPSCRVVILARPTHSLGLFLQQCGRASRPGLERSVILDHSGNVKRFHLPQADRTFSAGAVDLQTMDAVPMRACEECGVVVPLGVTECPGCGSPLRSPQHRSVPAESREDLIEVGLEGLAETLKQRAETLGVADPVRLVQRVLKHKMMLLRSAI